MKRVLVLFQFDLRWKHFFYFRDKHKSKELRAQEKMKVELYNRFAHMMKTVGFAWGPGTIQELLMSQFQVKCWLFIWIYFCKIYKKNLEYSSQLKKYPDVVEVIDSNLSQTQFSRSAKILLTATVYYAPNEQNTVECLGTLQNKSW